MPGTRPRQRLDVAQRREQLVTLGLEFFGDRPYDEVSIDEVARVAGISKGLLYHYFPSKREYYAACVLEAARQLVEEISTPRTVPPLDRLRAGVESYLRYVERHGSAYSALLRGGIGADAEVQTIIDRTRSQIIEQILEGVPLDSVTPLMKTTLKGWIGFVEAASIDWLAHKAIEPTTLRDLLANVLLNALGTIGEQLR
jgi:AcrR family transcriptional regulator